MKERTYGQDALDFCAITAEDVYKMVSRIRREEEAILFLRRVKEGCQTAGRSLSCLLNTPVPVTKSYPMEPSDKDALVVGNYQNTLLIHAIEKNFPSVTKWLIQHGADVNQGNSRYPTKATPPLYYAAAGGRSKIVALLLVCGADTSAVTLGSLERRSQRESVALLDAAQACIVQYREGALPEEAGPVHRTLETLYRNENAPASEGRLLFYRLDAPLWAELREMRVRGRDNLLLRQLLKLIPESVLKECAGFSEDIKQAEMERAEAARAERATPLRVESAIATAALPRQPHAHRCVIS